MITAQKREPLITSTILIGGQTMGTSCYGKFLVIIFVSAIMVSCIIGQRFAYHNVGLDLKTKGNKTVFVATMDNRAYVQNGEKSASYVGTIRGNFGARFDVKTESDKAFSDDVTSVVCNSLRLNGFNSNPIFVKFPDSEKETIELFRKKNADRLVLVIINDWYSDTDNSTSLTYELIVKVMDNQAQVLGQAIVKGKEEELGGGPFPDDARQTAIPAYKRQLESLLNNPSITAGLE
jgi:hypothetical protein